MSIEQSGQPHSDGIKPNRYFRRHGAGLAVGVNPQQVKIEKLAKQLNQEGLVRMETVKAHDKNLARIAYLGKPYNFGLLSAVRGLGEIFPEDAQGQLFFNEGSYVDLHSVNLYNRKFGRTTIFGKTILEGVSLKDIEEMQLSESGELSEPDVLRINEIFYNGDFFRKIPFLRRNDNPDEEQSVREASYLAVVQGEARPDIKIPDDLSLHPLRKRLNAYFDYYTDLLTGPPLGFSDESLLYMNLFLTAPWVSQILGSYIPARFDITPSSARKLIESRFYRSSVAMRKWRGFLEGYNISNQDAVRVGSYPEDLGDFLKYDPLMDEKAEAALRGYYDSNRFGIEEGKDITEENFTLAESLAGYHKHLQKDIIHSPNSRLEFRMPEGHVIEKVTLTTQTQNRNTIVYILHLKEGLHMAIELNRHEGFFGLPAKLSSDNSLLVYQLGSDLLNGVTNNLIPKHVQPEPIRITQILNAEAGRSEDIHMRKEPTAKTKQSIVMTPIRIALGLNELPSRRQTEFKTLGCSENEVIDVMPRNTQIEDINRIMAEINDVRSGRARIKKLHGVGDLWEARAGQYRIIFSREGNNLTLEKIGNRREVFSHQVTNRRYSV